jgi:lysophospholipase L1-like esterase
MTHLILLGDSIFDNAAYVEGGPSVIEQVTHQLPAGAQATLLAVDGDTVSDVIHQLQRLPESATHLMLSVGGNDALGCIATLEAPAVSVRQALVTLTRIKSEFRANYRSLLATVTAKNLPLLVCTIYDSVPGLPEELKTALGMFNDVILSEAVKQGLPVLDLRLICTDAADYSAASPIEPSSQGGAKVAQRLVVTVLGDDCGIGGCRVYC